jgi:hypothetical protein
VELKVILRGREVVEQHNRASTAREEVLQRQDLSTVTQRALRKQTHLGEAVCGSAWNFDPVTGVIGVQN